MKKKSMKKISLILSVFIFSSYARAATIIIDVMIVYDKSAVAYLNNQGLAQEDFARQLITRFQTPYTNSGLDVKFNYVHHMAIDYDNVAGTDGRNMSADLQYLQKNTVVRQAQKDHNADLVQMAIDIKHPVYGGWTSGIAYQYIPSNAFSYQRNTGYSVVSIQDIGTGISGTAAHEIGHNLGASHDPAHQASRPTFSYGQGYRYSGGERKYYTVMAYGGLSETESPYFSTPCKEFPTGTPVGKVGEYDNTRAISEVMAKVASYYGSTQTATAIDRCPAVSATTTYTVNLSQVTNGSLSCSPSSGVSGTTVNCTATPNSGYLLDTWSGACSRATGNSCSFTLSSNTSVGVVFKVKPVIYTVNLSSYTNGSLSCSPASGVSNTTVNCTATPNSGYLLDTWSGVCSSATGNNCSFALNSNVNVGATFKRVNPWLFYDDFE